MHQLAFGEGPASRAWRAMWVVALCALSTSACDLRTYSFGGGDDSADDNGPIDGGNEDGGGDDDGGPPPDAGPDACVAFPETCDGMDNDCDGVADNGFVENFDQDPQNCGGCDIRCDEPNTLGSCVSSVCQYECQPGFLDTDNNLNNGCEYFCTPTNGGVEACDVADNDCDTHTDEGLMLETDELNCGTCGNQCFALNAEPICTAGNCGRGACNPGFEDVIPEIPGCEYACPVNPPEAQEQCDGVDDDCDGTVDELPIAGLGDACADPGFEANMNVGRCTAGQRACSFGVPVCEGFVRPLPDDSACNGVDDDCNGATDEDVNFNDPRHCGSCTPCNLDNAVEGCSNGTCTVVACSNGFVDLDGNPGNGCEYACEPSGPETCDGRDNDCDGAVDTADSDLDTPNNFCRTLGACAGTTPTCAADPCTQEVSWTCDYGSNVETDSCGDLPLQEARCDEFDGDCDGATDESFAAKGDQCDDDGIGVCRRTGNLVCSTDHTALSCNLTSPVVPPSAEVCDNEDDNCDGMVDNGAPDDVVTVQNGASQFRIYTYEASRPDATAAGFGSASHRSCSKVGVLPWRNVTKTEAEAACTAAGKRLCTEQEWELSCGGASGLDFPYGTSYDTDACNGRDVDLDCSAPDSDAVAVAGRSFTCPTPGGTSACVSPTGAVDMSGNLREWTSTLVGTGAFRVRGGGYDNIEQGLRCDFSFIAFTPDNAFPNLGFRCCETVVP